MSRIFPWFRQLPCRLLGHNFDNRWKNREETWGRFYGSLDDFAKRSQWITVCFRCGDWGACPRDRYDISFGGKDGP